jgi:hypothetical protein
VKHALRQTKIRAVQIHYRININTLGREPAAQLGLNDIASVEFEANVPLLFDPYSSNRTTGSFILIDALSNATVGAGMIQEDLLAEPAGKPDETQAISADVAQAPVLPEEWYERHGHGPALFLLEGRSKLGARIERALFAQGFEVQHLGGRKVSPAALLEIARFTRRAGIILVYSPVVQSLETKQLLIAEMQGRFFDLTAAGAETADEETFRQALAIAKSLRITSNRNG